MKPKLTNEQLSLISKFISDSFGLHFPENRFPDLERIENIESYSQKILSNIPLSTKELDDFICKLTICETYFYRDHKMFQVLEYQILPDLIFNRRKSQKYIKIWHAGVATGEEAYTIAILLSKLIPDISDWKIIIIATDINRYAIDKAKKGIYSDWSFRNVPSWLKTQYFLKKDKEYEIILKIKKMITFSDLNLSETNYNFNNIDLIFCKNVLMYFTPECVSRVIDKLFDNLSEEGLLFVSPAEASHILFKRFKYMNMDETIFYCKQTIKSKPSPIPQNISFNFEPLPVYTDEKPIYYYEKAKINADMGNNDEALKWCDRGLSVHKMNPELYYLKALIHQEKGNNTEAVNNLRKTLYADPDFIMAHFILGNLNLKLNNLYESQKNFKNAADLLNKIDRNNTILLSEGLTAGELLDTIEIIRGESKL
ncbi:MAG: hypothetical protein HQK79_04950 [Desulfobacterales bacterium]|nr:hypothetical protein [Desulfobacterales bacterium]